MVDPNTRQGKRTPVTLKIKFKSETLEQFIERYAVDVSQGGIFIRTKEPLAVGTQMRFEFQLRDASPLIAGEGTVVWTRENDPSRPAIAPGMGVRFDRLAEGSQAVLERILSEKAKQAPQRGGGEITKPPMFTDTPTRVAPAPVQEALLGDSGASRPSGQFGDQATPLPKPVPFHSDAEDFDEQAFEEATKVRAVDELVAQSAMADGGDPKAAAAAAAASGPTPKPTTVPPVNQAAAPPPASEPASPFSDELAARRISRPEPIAEPPADANDGGDRDSIPSLPMVPHTPSGGVKAPRMLDATPSPRPETPSTPPVEATRTKLGVEPAPAPRPQAAAVELDTRERVRTPITRPPPDDEEDSVYPVKKKSSLAPTLILLLFVAAAAAAAVWFFAIRDKAKKQPAGAGSGSQQVAMGSATGSATATGSGLAPGSAGVMTGSATPGSAGPGSATEGSGSQMATTPGSAAEPPKGPTVDTVIASTPDKATVEVVGTDQKGTAPFTAKLEKDKAYQIKVTAPGFAPATLDVKGGAPKQTAKLDPKAKQIEVSSTPDVALIFLDNKMMGSTPKTIDVPKDKLGAKSFRLRIQKGGFKTVDKVIKLEEFTETDNVMTATLSITLEKAAAVVRPPPGTGSATDQGSGAAAGSGSTPPPGGDGSGGGGGSPGSGATPPPPPPPPPDEPEPKL